MLLLLYGNFCCNYFCIFYWYGEAVESEQLVVGIPLTTTGTCYFLLFNYLCVMSLVSHWRAAWAEPGPVPQTKEAPPGMEPERAKFCRKCDMNWKPERAHHCSECGKCVFKVTTDTTKPLPTCRWTTTAPG